MSTSYVAPPYVVKERFTERELFVGEDPWRLPATLTVPNTPPPHVALVLVHGSGPHDRDETIGPNRPFRDLAWGLGSRGLAVLRYDKRSFHHGKAMAEALGATVTMKEDTIDDALAALVLLRRHESIAAHRLFVLGHSQGATALPRIARRDPNIAGFIALAGSTRPLEDIILEQVQYLSSLDGKISTNEQKVLNKLAQQVAKVKTLSGEHSVDPSELPLSLGADFWLDLAAYDNRALLAADRRPFLVLQGERDYQVTLDDFAIWKSALKGNPNAQLKSYPQLNHLFMAGRGKSTPAEYRVASHVAPEVLTDIVNWVFR